MHQSVVPCSVSSKDTYYKLIYYTVCSFMYVKDRQLAEGSPVYGCPVWVPEKPSASLLNEQGSVLKVSAQNQVGHSCGNRQHGNSLSQSAHGSFRQFKKGDGFLNYVGKVIL
ncbi:MAG: hypothetical protein AB7T38_14515 [Nitrospirales bacterium]